MLRTPRKLKLLALVCCAVAPALGAQGDSCARRTLTVSVVNKAGVPIQDVKASDFRGELQGQPIQILSATAGVQPGRLVVLVDASGSMIRRGHMWTVARAMAINIISNWPAARPVALLVFSGQVDAKMDFPVDRQAAVSLLQKLADPAKTFQGIRSTALWDAVLDALTMLQPAQPGDVIYLLSDGVENVSRNRRDETEDALLRSGVRLFSLQFFSPDEFPGGMAGSNSRRNLVHLLEYSGGADFYLRKIGLKPFQDLYGLSEEQREQITRALREVYRAMGDYYQLEIVLPRAVDKPRTWRLRLEADTAHRREFTLRYPRKLLPCKAQ